MLTFAVRAPPLGLLLALPVRNSRKLVWEQLFFTFARFCCPRSPPGAAAGAAGAEFRDAGSGATLLHFCSLLVSALPPGAAAGAAGADSQEASFGATLLHFCLLLLSALSPGAAAGAGAEH